MPTKLKAPALTGTKSSRLEKASLIYQYGHVSGTSLLVAFDDLRAKRGNPPGVLPDQEQDVLRAVLVISCATLDASLKQVIRDALPNLLSIPEVSAWFEKFLSRRLANKAVDGETEYGGKFLAKVLAAPVPRERLIEEYVRELTGESLQSAEQVFSTAAALGARIEEVGVSHQKLKIAFDTRNKIIHELDIDLEGKKRVRRLRALKELLGYADDILTAARGILLAVDAKLK